MKIESVEIENFRILKHEKVSLNDYTSLVGPNGVGKSTVLSALNVFFQSQSGSVKDVSRMSKQDFYLERTEEPIRISVTFDRISDKAKEELKAYVRHDCLIVTAEAQFDYEQGFAPVKFYGNRLGIEGFRRYFEADKEGERANELKKIYKELQTRRPDLPPATTKSQMQDALRSYEESNRGECVEIPSEDQFYGVNSQGMLAQFVQWVYLPAVKDASEEGQEGRNTALALLVNRAVANRTTLDKEFEELQSEVTEKYRNLIKNQESALHDLSQSLKDKLSSWAHPGIELEMGWKDDAEKSVRIAPPMAEVLTGEGEFLGHLDQMGHGLQRSYLLALLQELSEGDGENIPTLILACEEPELYQHPPQARHLAEVFTQLSGGNAQVIVTTHSPFFVNGKGFENVRMVKREVNSKPRIRSLTFDDLCSELERIGDKSAKGQGDGLVAKVHQILQARVCEMFFTQCPILVEGPEDISYLTTALHISNRWDEFRTYGCHFIPVNGKLSMVPPLAIAKKLGLHVFAIFDSDSNCKSDQRNKHEGVNARLLALLESDVDSFPEDDEFRADHIVWKSDIANAVKGGFDEPHYKTCRDKANRRFDEVGDLGKNDLFIVEWLTEACNESGLPPKLERAVDTILQFSRNDSNLSEG
ncbi:MAG: AAA family ATPase [Ignavibacteriae bacterium]|nr:AAA family ATPase [Ignavibacteriota bacterium]MCB9216244.1 AAA family ATPase [Ignavibacteria bacterium]